jgi:large subunit ribosomal protein L13
MNREIIIDATDGVLGRVASYAAKESLNGKKVVIVNCNDLIISGRKENILSEYREIRAKRGHSLKGPKFPKIAERIVKRTVRGMLPHKKGRGADALKRVICYNVVPREYEESEKISLKKILKVKGIKLKELTRIL